MSESSSQDKTEKASPQKIKKAREQGQVPRAKEFTTAALFLVVAVYFDSQISVIWDNIAGIFRFNMSLTRQDLENPMQMIEQLGHSLGVIITLLLPLFVVIILVTLASTMVLGGWMFRMANTLPKLSKLNPVTGIKRMFSSRSLVELIKSFIKVLVIFSILYAYLSNHLQPLLGMQRLPLTQGVINVMQILFDGLLLMGLALLIFGVIDIPYQKMGAWKRAQNDKTRTKRRV